MIRKCRFHSRNTDKSVTVALQIKFADEGLGLLEGAIRTKSRLGIHKAHKASVHSLRKWQLYKQGMMN